METSQEQNFLNPTKQDSTTSATKQETEEPSTRLSSSSSSCSSIEAEPKPEENPNNNNAAQSPPTQVMERSTDDTPTTSSPTAPYKIPSHVFARTTSTNQVEWSTLSNESLFSIHMGNNSFTDIEYFKSGELNFPQPPSPRTPSLNTNQGGVVEEPKAPVDIAKKAAETDKAYRATKEEEQKAAASIREVIMANEAATKDNNSNSKFNRTISRRSEGFSGKSFAFQSLGNSDKRESQQTKPVLPDSPKASPEVEGDQELKKEEAPKPVTPKAEANRTPKWLSCFPCCTTLCG